MYYDLVGDEMIDWNMDLRFLKGVGPARIEILNKLGLFTLKDIITYFPRDYEDRIAHKKICELIDGETTTFTATIISRVSEVRIRRNMLITKVIASDGTGNALLTWYNQPYIKNTIKPNVEYAFYGKVKSSLGRLEINSPVFEEAKNAKNTGKIIPKYPLTNGITQTSFRRIMENAINMVDNQCEELLPEWVLVQNNLVDINYAIKNIHFPNEKR